MKYKPPRKRHHPQYVYTMRKHRKLGMRDEMERLHRQRVYERWVRLQNFKQARRESEWQALPREVRQSIIEQHAQIAAQKIFERGFSENPFGPRP